MRELIAEDSGLIPEKFMKTHDKFWQVEVVESCKNRTETIENQWILKPDQTIINIAEVLKEIRKDDKDLKFISHAFDTIDFHQQLFVHDGSNNFFWKGDDLKNHGKNELVTI